MTEPHVTPDQNKPAAPLVPLVAIPSLQTLDLGDLTGMVCDIDDPDCVAPAVTPPATTSDEDDA